MGKRQKEGIGRSTKGQRGTGRSGNCFQLQEIISSHSSSTAGKQKATSAQAARGQEAGTFGEQKALPLIGGFQQRGRSHCVTSRFIFI